jgi:hypothetical protein
LKVRILGKFSKTNVREESLLAINISQIPREGVWEEIFKKTI